MESELERRNLAGQNLAGRDLVGADLRWANLSGVDLSRASLIGADLSDADLSGTNLAGANLTDARLIDANRLEARFHLSNSEYARLLAGGDYRGRNAEVIWRIGDAAYDFKAVIDRVDGEIDAQSGGVDLYARILGQGIDGVLRPGAFVEVILDDRLFSNVVRLPESALHDDGSGRLLVYVIIGGRLEARSVEVVLRDGNHVLLRGSLADSEPVVITRLPEIGAGPHSSHGHQQAGAALLGFFRAIRRRPTC